MTRDELHNLRSSLGTILGAAQILSTERDQATELGCIGMIERHARKMLAMLDRLAVGACLHPVITIDRCDRCGAFVGPQS